MLHHANGRASRDRIQAPFELAPADVAAVEAVGEGDSIDGGHGSVAGLDEGRGAGGDGENSAADREQGARGVARGAGVEHRDARDRLGFSDAFDQAALGEGAGVRIGAGE